MPVEQHDNVTVSEAYGYNDDIVGVRNKGGSLSVCRLDDQSDESWNVAVNIGNFDDTEAKGTDQLSQEPEAAAIRNISERFYDSIPTYQDGDNLRSPRRITINGAEKCVTTDAPIDKNTKVKISDVFGYNDDIIGLTNKGGSLSLCRLDDDSASWWEVAVQLEDK